MHLLSEYFDISPELSEKLIISIGIFLLLSIGKFLCNFIVKKRITDIKRVYHHLAAEWVRYVEHLKLNYPFLFSLIVRMQPFKVVPSPVVR